MSSSPTFYNFGVELEMIARPRTGLESFNYTNNKPGYNVRYYERLAEALRYRGLMATSQTLGSDYKRPPGCAGCWITSDASLGEHENKALFELPPGDFTNSIVH